MTGLNSDNNNHRGNEDGTEPDDDGKIGYGRPPKGHRFQKGQSGNPKGRKKGTKNLKTDLEEELTGLIPVTIDGKKRKVTKQRAMVMATLAKAIKGEVKATNTILKLVADTFGYDPNTDQTKALSVDDQGILNSFLQQNKDEDVTGVESSGGNQEKPHIKPKARNNAKGSRKNKDNEDNDTNKGDGQ